MANIQKEKTKLIKRINKTGIIDKNNDKQPKAYKNEFDVISSYGDKDVVFEYRGNSYTQEFIKNKFPGIEYFIKPNVKPQVKVCKNTNGEVVKTIPVLTLQGDPEYVVTAPNKANGSDKNTRHLPVGWVLVKIRRCKGVYCVNPESFFTNPMVSIRKGKLIPSKYDYPMKYTKEDFPNLFRILVNSPEFTGNYGLGKNTWGNTNVTKLRKLTNSQIYTLMDRVNNLYKNEAAQNRYLKKIKLETATDADRKLYEYYRPLVYGENQRIMDDYQLGENRGILTDFRLWIKLSCDEPNSPLTENSKYEGVFVIPNLFSFVFIEMISDKPLNQCWEEV